MALHAVGAEHVISYQEPRMGMRQEGVVSGTVRFKGTKSENTYSDLVPLKRTVPDTTPSCRMPMRGSW